MPIRQATIEDVRPIQALINAYAKKDKMLARSLNELYESVRDFVVYEEKGKILGCAALHTLWDGLAEVKSLAVSSSKKGKGIGKKLLGSCLRTAKKLKVTKVFVLTYESEFFKGQGFKLIDKSTLPHKIWSECIKCFKFPDCDEEALIKQLKTKNLKKQLITKN